MDESCDYLSMQLRIITAVIDEALMGATNRQEAIRLLALALAELRPAMDNIERDLSTLRGELDQEQLSQLDLAREMLVCIRGKTWLN